jgi:orotate phosphoribosyltransferase
MTNAGKRRALVSPEPPSAAETCTSERPDAGAAQTSANGAKAGTFAGTRNETARRRLIVEDLMKAGLSIRMISEVTDIPRSSVHRAMGAVARAEAKKQLAIAEITAELLGKKLSHRRRGRA